MKSVGRPSVLLGRNVRQPDRVLANSLACDQPERRSGTDEEWAAATQHDWMKEEVVFVDQSKRGEACRELWSPDFDVAVDVGLQLSYRRLEIVADQRRVSPH